MTIIVVTEKVYNQKTNLRELVSTYGIDIDTGKNVVLQNIHPEELGAIYSDAYGEYVIEDNQC